MTDHWIGHQQAMRVPDAVGMVEGYRWWSVDQREGAFVLRSLQFPVLWPLGDALEAKHPKPRWGFGPWGRIHRHGDHARMPVPGCSCGIYALSAPSDLAEHPPDQEGLAFAGMVGLWGRVIRHELGYRAEHARPLALFLPAPPEPNSPASRLARAYGLRLLLGP